VISPLPALSLMGTPSHIVPLPSHSQPAVTLHAMGTAIGKTVNICELVKRKVPGLHQVYPPIITTQAFTHAESGMVSGQGFLVGGGA